MRVYIPAIAGAAALNTVSVLDALTKSNSAWEFLGDGVGQALFTPIAVGLDERPIEFVDGVRLVPGVVASNDDVPDLVVVPGLDDDVRQSLQRNQAWVGWVRRWFDRGAIIASSCTGAFVLAEAGILDGHKATTHWVAEPLFRASYPSVRLVIGPVVVDEGNVITSGGATTVFNLIHYLVSRFGSADRARAMTRLMQIDSGRESQLPFAMIGLHRQHQDDLVHSAQAAVQQGLLSSLTVAALADSVGVSSRTLGRRFQSAIGQNPQEYIGEVRVESAKRLLEQTSRTVDQIRQDIGFLDATALRRAFKRAVGITPTEYRHRFGTRQVADSAKSQLRPESRVLKVALSGDETPGDLPNLRIGD